MPRFFIPAGDRPPADGGQVWITGPDAVHIRRSLRMREGETLFLCDGEGTDYFCELAGFEGEGVLFRVLYHTPTALEPDTAVTLYRPEHRPLKAGRRGEETGAVAADRRRGGRAMRTGAESAGIPAPALRRSCRAAGRGTRPGLL